MATAAIVGDRAPVTLPSILALHDRALLEALAEAALTRLDEIDGDPDLELNGDELDGNGSEDDFMNHAPGANPMPGCPIADPDSACDDVPCDEPYQDIEPEDHEHAAYGVDQSKGPEVPMLSNDRSIMRPYLWRARSEACDRVAHWQGGTSYRLKGGRGGLAR